MSLPAWWGRELPCGCVRGVKLCAEAVLLWDAVADAHKLLAQAYALNAPTILQNAAYGRSLSAFTAHVDIATESAVQEPML